MPSLGDLTVRIGANTEGLRRGASEAQSTLGRLQRRMRDVARRAARMGAAAGLAGGALTAALVRRGLESVDAQAKLARSLGGTIDALRATQIAASDAGVSSDQLGNAMERLNQRIGEARRGSGRGAEALERLGLSAEELSGMDLDERMAAVSDAMREKGLSADQTADELRQLGIRNSEMIDFMRQGGDAIRDAKGEVDDFGLSLSAVDAAQVEAANDAMDRIGMMMESITQELAVQLAPIIQGIADLFSDAGREAGGFGNQVSSAVDTGVDAFAFMADAVESVRRGFVVAGQAVATLALRIRQEMLEAQEFIIGGPVRAINELIRTVNNLPGINFGEVEPPEIVQNVQSELAAARRATEIGKEEMNRTLMEPMPSEGIKEWVADQQEASRQAAESVVADREQQSSRVLQIQQAQNAQEARMAQEAAEKEQERREMNLENLREFLLNERDAEIEAHEERMEWLEEAHENELINEEKFREKKEALERRHQDELTNIERRGLSEREKFERASMATRTGIVADELQNMTSSVARENKAMFQLNKAAGIANAIINTHQGVTQALANYPPPVSFAMAAAQAAAGFAKVNAIRSQSMSGGGGGSAGSVGSAPSQAGARSTEPGTGAGETQTTRREITIRGEGITGALVREMIPELNEALDDGTRLQAG